jgi:hypothetical protein
MTYRLPSILFIMCSLYQCGRPEYLTEKELSEFIRNSANELIKEKKVDGVGIKICYRPTDLLVAQELKGSQQPTVDKISKARQKFGGHYYFIASFSKDRKELVSPSNQGLPGFSDLLQTISFQMGDKVNLTTPLQDTIVVADYIYNRTFGIGQSTDILFVFDKKKAESQKYVEFNLDEFGLGIGKQSFRFETKYLEDAPKIFHP